MDILPMKHSTESEFLGKKKQSSQQMSLEYNCV